MKFTITMKTPDAGYTQDIVDRLNLENLSDDEFFDTTEKITRVIHKFMEYQEYITVEFDTKLQTAKVVEANRPKRRK